MTNYELLRNWSQAHIKGNTFEYHPQHIAEAADDVLNRYDWLQQSNKAMRQQLNRQHYDPGRSIMPAYPTDPQQWTKIHDRRQFIESAINAVTELCGALEELGPEGAWEEAYTILKDLEKMYYGGAND